MPEIHPEHAPFPKAALGTDLTNYYVLRVDANGRLQIDVVGSALPAGAATAANQATMITALQLIDDLRGALQSVNTDDLLTVVTASALPAGAATAANQATMITALQLIDDLRNALDSVGTDELDVNVEASVLPAGAATAAHQVTQNTALQLIDNLVGALGSVNTDDLQVDIKTSALPAGAATAANQATMITALQLIDNLVNALDSLSLDEIDVNVESTVLAAAAATAANQIAIINRMDLINPLTLALQSVGTDRYIVRGEDQLHSYKIALGDAATGLISGANGWYESNSPPDGEVWVVTHITAQDSTNATTEHDYYARLVGANHHLCYKTSAFAAGRYSDHQGRVWLEHDDTIRVYFAGGQVGDTCVVRLVGHVMSKE